MKSLLIFILDISVSLYICTSLLFVTVLCSLFWDVALTKEACYIIAALAIMSWAIIFIATVSDYLNNSLIDDKQREMWLNVFKWGFYFSGLGLGVIVYYCRVLRKRLRAVTVSDLASENGAISYIPQIIIKLGYKLDKVLFNSLFVCFAAILTGFIIKSDFLYDGAIKTTTVIFFAFVFAGMPFELVMLNHLVTQKWEGDVYKEYLFTTHGFHKYYDEIYEKRQR